MSATAIVVDPLSANQAELERLVELTHRWGRYRVYGEGDGIAHPLGQGLLPRHDSVLHFLRHGGRRGTTEDLALLTARTAYFREEYAYDGGERIGGAQHFLHHPRLIDAAVRLYGRPLVEPAIVFANLMVPGQELVVHTDVPEFRGANRKNTPQWLLAAMHHSGLFEPWRLHIATGIAYVQDGRGGALRYWADGADGQATTQAVRADTAIVLDTDTVPHGVDPVGGAAEPPPVGAGATLASETDGTWTLSKADGETIATYRWEELRCSVSWKAYCFTDEADRGRWQDHTDDLTSDQIIDRLVRDLVDRGLVEPDVPLDRNLGLLVIDTYIHYPAA